MGKLVSQKLSHLRHSGFEISSKFIKPSIYDEHFTVLFYLADVD